MSICKKTKNDYDPLFTTVNRIPSRLNYLVERVYEMDDSEFNDYSEELRKYFISLYENDNFPGCIIIGRSFDKIVRDFRHFNNEDFSNILASDSEGKKNVIKCFDKTFSGVNHWFPEMYDVKRNSSGLSAMDPFRDKTMFHKSFYRLIKKDALNFRRNNLNKKQPEPLKISDTLSGFRILNGVIPISNFPSGVAKFLYSKVLNKKKFSQQNEVNILDQSMGWGGRMLGALSATTQGLLGNRIVNYNGTDVNTTTHDRFEKILKFWDHYVAPHKLDTYELIHNFNMYKSLTPAEDLLDDNFFKDKIGSYDMSFTSPPYFNTEKYSEDDTQSYKRYPTYTEWSEGFLQNMIKTTYKLMKRGGESYINIADVRINSSKDIEKAFLPIERDTLKYAEEIGFKYKGKLKMMLSTMSGTGTVPETRDRVTGVNIVNVDGVNFKYEPIFIFVKE